MKKMLITTTAIAALLTACSSSDQDVSADQPTQASSESTAPSATLMEVCPDVEAALQEDMVVPTEEQLDEIREDLEEIRDGADTEAQNALDLFLSGIDDAEAAYQDTEATLPMLEVSRSFDGGVRAFATRCKAAGSSALQ